MSLEQQISELNKAVMGLTEVLEPISVHLQAKTKLEVRQDAVEKLDAMPPEEKDPGGRPQNKEVKEPEKIIKKATKSRKRKSITDAALAKATSAVFNSLEGPEYEAMTKAIQSLLDEFGVERPLSLEQEQRQEYLDRLEDLKADPPTPDESGVKDVTKDDLISKVQEMLSEFEDKQSQGYKELASIVGSLNKKYSIKKLSDIEDVKAKPYYEDLLALT